MSDASSRHSGRVGFELIDNKGRETVADNLNEHNVRPLLTVRKFPKDVQLAAPLRYERLFKRYYF